METKSEVVKKGNGLETIQVINAEDPSERTFLNDEFVEEFGSENKISVIWESPKKLISLDSVKIWASNDQCADDGLSQCGLWGVKGDGAYKIALAALERHPKLFPFYENGKHYKNKEVDFEEYDSVFLCIRSAHYEGWRAACQGYEVKYTYWVDIKFPDLRIIPRVMGPEDPSHHLLNRCDSFKSEAIYHEIGNNDRAAIIGVSKQDIASDQLQPIGVSCVNDINLISDICHLRIGLRPKNVKILSSSLADPIEQPSAENIRTVLKDLFESAGEEDLVIVYYSGHGIQYLDKHYLVPQDYNPTTSDEDEFARCSVSAEEICEYISNSKSRKILFMLDCCYAGMFGKNIISLRNEEAEQAAEDEEYFEEKKIWIFSSSQDDKESLMDNNLLGHGYMTFFIRHYMHISYERKEVLSIKKMLDFITKYQEPLSEFDFEAENNEDNMVFIRPDLAFSKAAPGPNIRTSISGVTCDRVFWRNKIEKSDAYRLWWTRDRLPKAKMLLEDTTFIYSKISTLIFLHAASSIVRKLVYDEKIWDGVRKLQDFFHNRDDEFCKALEQLLKEDLKEVAHPDYDEIGAGADEVLDVVRKNAMKNW